MKLIDKVVLIAGGSLGIGGLLTLIIVLVSALTSGIHTLPAMLDNGLGNWLLGGIVSTTVGISIVMSLAYSGRLVEKGEQ